jgi:hypothetical protein
MAAGAERGSGQRGLTTDQKGENDEDATGTERDGAPVGLEVAS